MFRFTSGLDTDQEVCGADLNYLLIDWNLEECLVQERGAR